MFYCRRIGKIEEGKTQPVFVEFSREQDSCNVLQNAFRLENMQVEWPRHHSTRLQRETHRKLRAELKTRRASGERVILIRVTLYRTSAY